MAIVTVYALHTEQVNEQHDKFYRTYAFELHGGSAIEIRQWGRRGATGQFKTAPHGSLTAARSSALSQIDSKERKGYSPANRFTFEFDNDRWTGAPKVIADVAEAALRGEATAPDQTPTRLATESAPEGRPAPTVPLSEIQGRSLEAITLSMRDRKAALVEFAHLQTAWADIATEYEAARGYLDTLEKLVISEE